MFRGALVSEDQDLCSTPGGIGAVVGWGGDEYNPQDLVVLNARRHRSCRRSRRWDDPPI